MADEDWGGPVRWRYCHISGTTLICQTERYHNVYTVGSAPIAYTGDASYPWKIAVNQGGSAVYTWRKSFQTIADFQDERSFVFSPQAVLPAIGSRLAIQARRYIYSLDD